MKIVMCSACQRQYDASRMPSDSLLRCLCGQAVSVELEVPHEPRALRCSSCGAPFKNDDRHCGHCKSETTIEERFLSAICPGCGARMSEDARFCMECGLGIAPQKIAPLKWEANCPRCEGALRHRSVDDRLDLIECSACAGIWLEPESFRNVVKQAKKRHYTGEGRDRDEAAPELERHPMRYLPCPVCEERMTPRMFGEKSGIMVDVCRDHGVWLDHRELEAITRWIETHGKTTDLHKNRELDYGREEKAKPVATPYPGTLQRKGWASGWDAFDVLREVVGDFFTIID